MAPTVTTPLLPISTAATTALPTPSARPSPPQLPQQQARRESLANRLQRLCIATFCLVRLLRGVSLVVYPRFGLYALDVPSDGSSCMLASLIGVRDILLAGLLHTADVAGALAGDHHARREVSRALAVNLLSDAVDAFVLIFYAAWSSDWGNPLAVIIITAVMAILEHLTLWSLSEDEWEALEHRSVEEDKVSRMNAWLRELGRFEQAVPESSRDSVRRYGDMA
ncbi:hypothetical protein B0T10DRAFT_253598 [Thelonectria olida]|uniref:Uncharacterized protein n=1 Tax=Thelonectria olida TaxID=1576542 RepID=A0A9P8WB14_9HYPO|nr:hypothetical protein B0T10DRAFT_253598 [Thelonectria olida]